jgi:hypothetical protein
MAVRILSESSGIRFAKTGKTAGFQWSNTLDVSSRNRKPWKAGINGIQEVVGSTSIRSTIRLAVNPLAHGKPLKGIGNTMARVEWCPRACRATLFF